MFTQQCFIRKNSEQLRDKLTDLGYELKNGKCIDEYDSIFTQNFEIHSDENEEGLKSRKCGIYYGAYYEVFQSNKNKDLILEYVIDCGTNEELFLAIAALRDDSDIDNNQVFIHQDGNFYKCECDSKIDMWGDFEESESYPIKATVSELIELFNK